MNNKSHGQGGPIGTNGSSRLRGLVNKGGLLPMSIHRVIYFRKLRHILVCSGLALFMVCAVIPGNPIHAQEPGEPEEFGTPESPIPIHDGKRYKPEVVLPLQYPNGFHGYGRIDVLDEDGVIIADVFIKLAPYVTYHTPTNMDSYMAEFNPGDLVGWLKNLEGEIISLWLIP